MTHFSSSSCYFEPWLNYKHAVVRQLAFCVASPNILSQLPPELDLEHQFDLHEHNVWQQHYANYETRLEALDQNPTELLHFIQQLKSTRLGLRFEMLMWFWLLDRDFHAYELLGHSIQKIAGSQTLGELDFVLRNTESGQIEHWEVALKYYLAETDYRLANWYGLNRSDTLSLKLQHFTQKQFRFSDALDYPIEKHYCVLKGQLYLNNHSTQTAPTWINTQRRLGLWGQHFPLQASAFYRLQRHEWICSNAQCSSLPAKWWTNGLYKHSESEQYFMYRQAHLIHKT